MLGDPAVLLLDEPANGLDPEGIQWVRAFLKALAGQGRTVFVSSHLLAEMALMADDLVVIGRGRLHRPDDGRRVRGPEHAELGGGPQPRGRPARAAAGGRRRDGSNRGDSGPCTCYGAGRGRRSASWPSPTASCSTSSPPTRARSRRPSSRRRRTPRSSGPARPPPLPAVRSAPGPAGSPPPPPPAGMPPPPPMEVTDDRRHRAPSG